MQNHLVVHITQHILATTALFIKYHQAVYLDNKLIAQSLQLLQVHLTPFVFLLYPYLINILHLLYFQVLGRMRIQGTMVVMLQQSEFNPL